MHIARSHSIQTTSVFKFDQLSELCKHIYYLLQKPHASMSTVAKERMKMRARENFISSTTCVCVCVRVFVKRAEQYLGLSQTILKRNTV